MSDDASFRSLSLAELIGRSSFGSPDVLEVRRQTPALVKRQLLAALTCRDGAPGRRDTGPYFVMSVPPAPGGGRGDQVEVRRFFRLVCTYLGQAAADVVADESSAAPGRLPGVLAGPPGAGGLDPARVPEALASCRVFVPLLSGAYFDDDSCRAQWETFRRRDEGRRARHPFGFSAIVPVLWDRPADISLPLGATDLQVADAALGRDYAERGMRALLAENGPVCRKVAFRLSRRILGVAECLPEPDDRPGDPRPS